MFTPALRVFSLFMTFFNCAFLFVLSASCFSFSSLIFGGLLLIIMIMFHTVTSFIPKRIRNVAVAIALPAATTATAATATTTARRGNSSSIAPR